MYTTVVFEDSFLVVDESKEAHYALQELMSLEGVRVSVRHDTPSKMVWGVTGATQLSTVGYVDFVMWLNRLAPMIGGACSVSYTCEGKRRTVSFSAPLAASPKKSTNSDSSERIRDREKNAAMALLNALTSGS